MQVSRIARIIFRTAGSQTSACSYTLDGYIIKVGGLTYIFTEGSQWHTRSETRRSC